MPKESARWSNSGSGEGKKILAKQKPEPEAESGTAEPEAEAAEPEAEAAEPEAEEETTGQEPEAQEQEAETGQHAQAQKMHNPPAQAQEAHKKAKKPWKIPTIPLYVAIILFVAGLAIGEFAGMLTVQCADANVSCPSGDAVIDKTVDVQLLYSGKCTICEKSSSILAYLTSKNIQYNLTTLDIETAKGKELADFYGLVVVPTALVSEKNLKYFTDTKIELDNAGFVKKSGNYAVPEAFYDRTPHNLMFLESPEKACVVPEGKARVDEFLDYLCPACSSAQEPVEALKQEFGNEAEFNIRNFVIHDKPAEKIAIAAECARNQGKFDEFKTCIFRKRFTDSLDTSDTAVLIDCASEAKISPIGLFAMCLDEEQTKDIVAIDSGSDFNAARAYNLMWTPSFVIDCKFPTVGVDNVKGNVCSLHPDFNACK